MANPLTGDYDVVLQVSGATINRLLASMHQNTDPDSKLPKFPHSVSMRIGDPTPIDGMRGTAWAQVSVPLIELIHGEDDRFNLEVAIRARYRPDPGTTPLPEFIHGTIRAQYRIHSIDPNCWGWGKAGADYLWVKVVPDTVSFDGTAVDDQSVFELVQQQNPAEIDSRITRLATFLLKHTFKATPQKVEKRFRRGSMRSLHPGMNRSAVAVPLAGQGQIASIDQEFLDNRHFGVAISKALIESSVQAELDNLTASFVAFPQFTLRVSFAGYPVLTVNITWRLTLANASAEWTGGVLPFAGGSVGVITVKVTGQARTPDPKYNFDVHVTQLAMVTFNSSSEEFAVNLLGSPTLVIPGLIGEAIDIAGKKGEIGQSIESSLKTEVSKLAAHLSVKNRKGELIDQLKRLDPAPAAQFESALFSPDGIVVRGFISLSQRKAPVTEFVKTAEQDGFNAFSSWIPGGRIDSFNWTWSWMNSWKGDPGSQTHTDRYVLKRPGGTLRTKFGLVKDISRPLPVIDGYGSMCLTMRGWHVHPFTGALVPVTVKRKCMRAGLDIRIQGVAGGRVFLKDWVRSERDPIGPVQEVSIIDVGGGRTDRAPNTLVVHAGERWNPEIGTVLRDALAGAQRLGAGLQVLLLFADGTLANQGRLLEELSRLDGDLEAPLTVNEDVRGSWSAALVMDSGDGEVQWRLITPTGGVSWGHRGRIDPRQLARVLDTHLYPAPPPGVQPLVSGIVPGAIISPAALDSGLLGDIADYFAIEDQCPPPLGLFSGPAHAVFVQADSVSSQSAIKQLAERLSSSEGEYPMVALVVDGASADELERLRGTLPEQFIAIPDPRGNISSRLGIRTWPTSVSINDGAVTTVEIGAPPGGGAPDTEAAS